MSVIDFFSDSMGFVTKLTATLASNLKELKEVLKPHDNIMTTMLET